MSESENEPLFPKDKKEWGFLLIGFYLGIIINYIDLWLMW